VPLRVLPQQFILGDRHESGNHSRVYDALPVSASAEGTDVPFPDSGFSSFIAPEMVGGLHRARPETREKGQLQIPGRFGSAERIQDELGRHIQIPGQKILQIQIRQGIQAGKQDP